jgi:23S rRNA pseudoU1915 N3-methylase RlmH
VEAAKDGLSEEQVGDLNTQLGLAADSRRLETAEINKDKDERARTRARDAEAEAASLRARELQDQAMIAAAKGHFGEAQAALQLAQNIEDRQHELERATELLLSGATRRRQSDRGRKENTNCRP